jgi:hypothetical protein
MKEIHIENAQIDESPSYPCPKFATCLSIFHVTDEYRRVPPTRSHVLYTSAHAHKHVNAHQQLSSVVTRDAAFDVGHV